MKTLLLLLSAVLASCNLSPQQQMAMRMAAANISQQQAMNQQMAYNQNQQVAANRYNAAQQQANRNAYLYGQMFRRAPVYNVYAPGGRYPGAPGYMPRPLRLY